MIIYNFYSKHRDKSQEIDMKFNRGEGETWDTFLFLYHAFLTAISYYPMIIEERWKGDGD